MSQSNQAEKLFESLLKNALPALGQKITPQPVNKVMPLSFSQQRLWLLDQLEPGNPAYNVIRAFRVTGPLEVTIFDACLNEIVNRHATLRTTFTATDGQPVQVIHPTLPSPVQQIDLSHMHQADQERQARQAITQASRTTFDLSQGPLWRSLLIRFSPTEHRFLLVMHHIISDGWSLGVFFRELADLYPAFAQGQPSPLPSLPIQYTDFTLWQQGWLQGETLTKQLAYWQQQFQELPDVLNLPSDHPRPAKQTHQGARVFAELSPSLVTSLKELSQQAGTTLFMTLLAAFDVLLYRYTGQEDIVVGSPIANRTRAETTGLIGCFINTLALRADLSGNPTFRELLSRVQQTALDAYQHQDLPFEKLVEVLQPERRQGYSPLFQVLLVLQNTPPPTLTFSDIQLIPLPVDNETTQFDLTLTLIEEAGSLQAVWKYDTDLFEPDTIRQMARHYQTLLTAIVTNPDQPISTLPLLTEAEWQQIVVDWNKTEAAYPQVCIHQLLEAQVEQTPHATALVFEDKEISYAELNRRANQVAHYLQSQGVGPEVLVGLCIERSIEMIIGLFGILKAGGAYVPLDPIYPQERLQFVIEDSGLKLILTQHKLSTFVETLGVTQICFVEDIRHLVGNTTNNNPNITPDNLAYMIYTSGSTGQPKGVAVEHRGVVNMVSFRRAKLLPKNDMAVAPLLLSISFDGSLSQILGPFSVGGKLIIVKDFATLFNCPQINELTYLSATSSMLKAILLDFKLPTSIQAVGVGAEAVDEETIMMLRDRSHIKKIINVYGPTEASIYCSAAILFDRKIEEKIYKKDNVATSAKPPTKQPITIGKPIQNVQIYILDEHLQPVPIGVPGNIYVGGIGLARGYFGHSDLTAESFIELPKSLVYPRSKSNSDSTHSQVSILNSKLYKTGDLGRYLPDGNIQFLGRGDNQVKIRGFRIELGEIEATLSQHPAVESCVVIATEDQPGDKRLVAYIVTTPSPTIIEASDNYQSSNLQSLISDLRQYLKTHLPDYMLPSAFVELDTLPLTPNGKINCRALPGPDPTHLDILDFVAPNSPAEKMLAEIWQDILNLEQISVHDNFFELGGHSLLAAQSLSRLFKTYGVELSLRQLFELPTIAELALAIEAIAMAQIEAPK